MENACIWYFSYQKTNEWAQRTSEISDIASYLLAYHLPFISTTVYVTLMWETRYILKLICKTEKAVTCQTTKLVFAVKIRPCREAIKNLLPAGFGFLSVQNCNSFLVDTH